MLDRWFSVIKLPLNWRQFHQLPQNAAYKKVRIPEQGGLAVAPAQVFIVRAWSFAREVRDWLKKSTPRKRWTSAGWRTATGPVCRGSLPGRSPGSNRLPASAIGGGSMRRAHA